MSQAKKETEKLPFAPAQVKSPAPAAPINGGGAAPPYPPSQAHTIWTEEAEPIHGGAAPLRLVPRTYVRISEKAESWRGHFGMVEVDAELLIPKEGRPIIQESVLVELAGGYTCYQRPEYLTVVEPEEAMEPESE